MVEGDKVHRYANRHRKTLKGQRFKAISPNGRFTDGAKAIDGKILYRVEAVGKNLFHFYCNNGYGKGEVVVVHMHFGMNGHFYAFPAKFPEKIPGVRLDALWFSHPRAQHKHTQTQHRQDTTAQHSISYHTIQVP